MNSPIQVDDTDFILQSLSTIGVKIPKKTMYVLMIKSYQCHYCIEYQPIFEQFATKFPNVGFLLLEASANTRMLKQWKDLVHPEYTVNGYPTVIMYKADGDPSPHVIKDRTKLNEDIMQMTL
jgi:thiol-disulfide isomerase/thioredoxin